jgi:hypothetical protein
MGALDVDFNDMDGNGFTDVVFVCEGGNNYIYLASGTGFIQTEPAWTSAETSNFINSVVTGKMQPDHLPCLLMTGNDQIGGDGKIRQYTFSLPFPSSSSASWTSDPVGYGSGIFLADVTRDDTFDLIYGGWWHPLEILVGDGDNFNSIPAFTSGTSSVIETIKMADLAKENLIERIDTLTIEQPEAAVITLRSQIIESIEDVVVNGTSINPSTYKTIPGRNLIFFNGRLFFGDQVIIKYTYCLDGDIVITNWDSTIGNYIFYNTNEPAGIGEDDTGNTGNGILTVYPNPASHKIHVQYVLAKDTRIDLKICDLAGRDLETLFTGMQRKGHYQTEKDISFLKAGVYMVRLATGDYLIQNKLIILN